MENRGRITIADVALHAGVSRAAVSKVIRDAYGVSDQMRVRVNQAIEQLDYRPNVVARSMRGSSYTIGVEIPNTANPFFDRLINALTSSLAGTPYRVVLAPAGVLEDSAHAIQMLADRQVAGILAIGANAHADWLEEQGRRQPLVLLGRHEDSAHYDTVVDDDALGTRQVMAHLQGLGHRDIVHVTIESSRHPNMSRSGHAVRSRTYVELMEHKGLEPRVELVVPTEDAAYSKTCELLEQASPPTAIYAGHDELALGVLRALAERRMTAADVSVVGYDDSKIASHPLISLTTIRQPVDVIGRMVAELLLQRIDGRKEPVHEVVTPELVVRGSTVPPRSAPPQ